MRSILAALLLGLCSCVTSGDINDLAHQVRIIEDSLQDETKTTDQVKEDVAAAHEAIGAIAERVEERTEGFIKGVSQGTEGGLMGLLGVAALHLYRNSTRKREIAEAKKSPANAG